jgi:hypothetical protein
MKNSKAGLPLLQSNTSVSYRKNVIAGIYFTQVNCY